MPDPEPSVPTVLSCSYQGTFRIAPASSPCNTKFVALTAAASNCSKATVNLRTATQMRNNMKLAEWKISSQGAAPLSILARADCSARALTAPKTPTSLRLGGLSWKWTIVPADAGDDCNLVNLVTQNWPITTYLSVPRTGDRFSWAAGDGGRQRFVLKKVG